jgi:hypothetical protein
MKGTFAGQKKDNLYVQNGDRAWSKDDGRETIAISPNWEAGGTLGQVLLLPTLSGEGKKYTPIRNFKFAGRTVVGIKEENREIFFDNKTWLVAGNKITLKRQPKDVVVETTFFDYHEFQGIQFPRKLEHKMNGKVIAINQITKIQILDKLDDNLFDKPN